MKNSSVFKNQKTLQTTRNQLPVQTNQISMKATIKHLKLKGMSKRSRKFIPQVNLLHLGK